VRAGMSVLDFGCGPGGFSLAAGRLAGRHGRVYSVDVQPIALRTVWRRAARQGLGNVIPLSAERIGEIPDESMDMVLAYDVLHIHPEPQWRRDVVGLLHRVLKPKGVLSARDHHLDNTALTAMLTEGGLFRLVTEGRTCVGFERLERREPGG